MQIQPLPSQTFPPLPHRQLHLSFYPLFLIYYKYICIHYIYTYIYISEKKFFLSKILLLFASYNSFLLFFCLHSIFSPFLRLLFLYFLITSGFYPRLSMILLRCLFFFFFNFYPRFVSLSSRFVVFLIFIFISILTCDLICFYYTLLLFCFQLFLHDFFFEINNSHYI